MANDPIGAVVSAIPVAVETLFFVLKNIRNKTERASAIKAFLSLNDLLSEFAGKHGALHELKKLHDYLHGVLNMLELLVSYLEEFDADDSANISMDKVRPIWNGTSDGLGKVLNLGDEVRLRGATSGELQLSRKIHGVGPVFFWPDVFGERTDSIQKAVEHSWRQNIREETPEFYDILRASYDAVDDEVKNLAGVLSTESTRWSMRFEDIKREAAGGN